MVAEGEEKGQEWREVGVGGGERVEEWANGGGRDREGATEA